MSWFDDLFSNKENSDEELLRRKSKRRNGDLTQNKDDSLLPENNDIYDRPRGKFRFPIDVGQDDHRLQRQGGPDVLRGPALDPAVRPRCRAPR